MTTTTAKAIVTAATAPVGGETSPTSEPADSTPSVAPAAAVADDGEAETVDPLEVAPSTVDHDPQATAAAAAAAETTAADE